MSHQLTRRQLILRSVEETFAFFADAFNLEAITPPSVRFEILTPRPIQMGAGTLIDYRIKVSRLPLRWRTRIEVWEPNSRFVDVQLSGPYKYWRHLHEFAAADGGTLVTDRVDYELPLGPLGTVAHALYVRRALQCIFDFRRERVAELLGESPASR